jgi:hypothetical protein
MVIRWFLKFPLLCFTGFGENEVGTLILASPMTVLIRQRAQYYI